MESDPIFQSHGCKSMTKLSDYHRDWLSKNAVKESKFNAGQPYIAFQSDRMNHFLWGGSYGSADPIFGSNSIEDLVNSEFSKSSFGVTLMTYDMEGGLIVSANKFTLSLGLSFRQWAGYTKEFLVIDMFGKRSFLLDDAWGYCVYSRDQRLYPGLASFINDTDLVTTFQKISSEYGIGRIDADFRNHLALEILPLCDEKLP